MHSSLRFAGTTGAGAFIGALCALELQHFSGYGSWLPILGCFLGGVFAYLAHDIRAVGASIARAWRETITLRPNKERWKTSGALALILISMYSSAICFVVLPMYFLDMNKNPKLFTEFLVVIPAILTMVVGVIHFFHFVGRVDKKKLVGFRQSLLEGVLWVNPVGVLWGLARYTWRTAHKVPALVLWVLTGSWAVTRVLGSFTARAARYVHTDRRAMAFAYATTGAAAGYYAGSALLGAGVGFVLGFIGYRLVAPLFVARPQST
jgi:hypothetical protein